MARSLQVATGHSSAALPRKAMDDGGSRICDEFVMLLQGVLKLVPIIRSTASEAWVLSQGIVESM